MSTNPLYSATNRHQLSRARHLLTGALRHALSKAFFGRIDLHLSIADGTIQHVHLTTTQTQRPNHAEPQPPTDQPQPLRYPTTPQA